MLEAELAKNRVLLVYKGSGAQRLVEFYESQRCGVVVMSFVGTALMLLLVWLVGSCREEIGFHWDSRLLRCSW